MSFEMSPRDRKRARRVSNGYGLSVLVTLISPLFAVLLSQYLNTRPKSQTTFALPVPKIGVSLPEGGHSEPGRPELPATEGSSENPVEAWRAFALQPEKQALAKRLIAAAGGAKNDPASQFAMLHRAKDVAVQASDGQTAFQAIDAMAETFHADADAMKMSVLTKLASVARKPAQHKLIAEQALKLGSRAAGQEHLMVANQLGRLARAEAKQALDDDLLAKAHRQIAEMAEQARRDCPNSRVNENGSVSFAVASRPSGDGRQQAGARLVQKLNAKAQQGDATDHCDDLLAAKSTGL
jgi:hypothetical protein